MTHREKGNDSFIDDLPDLPIQNVWLVVEITPLRNMSSSVGLYPGWWFQSTPRKNHGVRQWEGLSHILPSGNLT